MSPRIRAVATDADADSEVTTPGRVDTERWLAQLVVTQVRESMDALGERIEQAAQVQTAAMDRLGTTIMQTRDADVRTVTRLGIAAGVVLALLLAAIVALAGARLSVTAPGIGTVTTDPTNAASEPR